MAGYGLADAMYDLNKGMEQGQDRKFQVEQREKDAEFKAESQARQRQDWGLQDSDRAYQGKRRKVTDQRADEQWARTQELWKDDDAKRAYENSLMTAKKALQVFETSGGQNWGGIIEWYNDTNNYDNGLDIKDVKRAPDGSFTATFNNGQTKVYKDVNDVREQMAMAMHPDAWIKLRADRKYGGSGSVPAERQMMEYYQQIGLAKTPEEAYQLYRNARSNPRAEAARIANTIFKEQSNLPPSRRRGYDDLFREAYDLLATDAPDPTPAPGYGLNPDPAAATAPQQGRAPAAGAVIDGYRFRGGNPNDQKNWEAAK